MKRVQLLSAGRVFFFPPRVCVCVCVRAHLQVGVGCWECTQWPCVADHTLGFAAGTSLVFEHMCLSGETAGKYDPLMSRLHTLASV